MIDETLPRGGAPACLALALLAFGRELDKGAPFFARMRARHESRMRDNETRP